MVDQDGDQSRAAGQRVVGDQQETERAVREYGGVILSNKLPFARPRLLATEEDHSQGKIDAVLNHLQERALEEMGDLFAQLRRTAVQPEKPAPSDLNGYVLVKRVDLVSLVVSVYGPHELNKRLRELIYAYKRQGDD